MQLLKAPRGVAPGGASTYDTRVMRALAALAFLAAVAGCRCVPDVPAQVTLRVRNTAKDPIYVDDTNGMGGLRLLRAEGFEWRAFAEAPPCACLSCDLVCGGCGCPDGGAGTPRVRKLMPGQVYERTWGGIVQIAAVATCGQLRGGTGCLAPQNAPYDETFRLQLCYQSAVPGLPESPDGGSVAAVFPTTGQLCATREFRPVDGQAEVAPERGADCVSSADCRGKDELCFSGACTAGCPPNDFPPLSSTWAVRLGSVDDQGFFARSTDGGTTVWTGAGTVASALYNANSLSLRLTRTGPSNVALVGGLSLTLPQGYAPPLPQGTPVAVKVIDAASSQNPENRAVVIRDDQGHLLLAADVGQGGSLLAADDLAPFEVTWGSQVLGCRITDCGKELSGGLRVSGPAGAVDLQPGNSAVHVTVDGTWRLLNVGNASYPAGSCTLKVLRPFLLYREQGP